MFIIAPRINAVGRLDEGLKVVDIFTHQDIPLLKAKLVQVNQFNDERKLIDKSITHEALSLLDENPNNKSKTTTVLCQDHWHKGVIGIVASRVMETYYRPTIICTSYECVITCSCRSVREFNILEALDQCSDLFLNYGGHFYAAGLSMKAENFEVFQNKFEEVVSKTIEPELLIPTIKINAEAHVKDLTLGMYNILDQMQPFGHENPLPVFVLKNVVAEPSSIRILKDLHLSFVVTQDNYKMRAIGFNMSSFAKDIDYSQPFDMAFQLMKNEFNNNVSIEARVLDIKPHHLEN